MTVLDKSVIPSIQDLISKMYKYAPEELQERADRMIHLLESIPQ